MKRIVCMAICLLLAVNVYSWGLNGHRVVGEIADHHLSNRAKKEIKELLGYESLAMASNWSDFMKSDPKFYQRTFAWHFINVGDNLEYQQFAAAIKEQNQPNAYNMLLKLIDDLKSEQTSKKEKVFALKFIIHLVGDIHQPLHVGRAEDQGGNKIDVEWFGRRTNLHRVWDKHLIDYQQLSYTEMARAYDHASRQEVQNWQNDAISQWFFESYSLSRKIYATVKPHADLRYRYNFDHAKTMEQRLLQGGIRLAGLLNRVLG